MSISSALALFLLGIFHQACESAQIPENPPPEPNCHDPSVTAFSAAFYTAMVFSNDPDIIFTLKLPSNVSSPLFYRVVLEELNNFAVCNAVIVAKTVAKGAAFLPVFNLPDYFRLKGFTVGDYLYRQGILNCDNAVRLAFEYYQLVQGLLDGLDGTSMESYIRSITGGLLTWTEQQGFNLPEASYDLSFLFYDEFSNAY